MPEPDTNEDPLPSTLREVIDTDGPLPALCGRLPFETSFTFGGGGAAPPLVVEVVFGRALTDDEKDRFDRETRVWATLVQGGYPEPDEFPGGSTIGLLTDNRTARSGHDGRKHLQPLGRSLPVPPASW